MSAEAKATVQLFRGPHRSTVFGIRIDISGLMDEQGQPLATGEELEEILYGEVRERISEFLKQGRLKVKNHP